MPRRPLTHRRRGNDGAPGPGGRDGPHHAAAVPHRRRLAVPGRRRTRLDIVDDTEPDLDALELHADKHAFDTLTPAERAAVMWRFGLDGGTPLST